MTRKAFGSALRVALVTSLVVVVAYAGAVALLDDLVSDRLVAQVDRQLDDRLTAAHSKSPAAAAEEPGTASGRGHYGLGIYGEPIYVWEIAPDGRLRAAPPGIPALPRLGLPTGTSSLLTASVAGTEYRLSTVPYRGGLLVAGESLSELTHVEHVLVTSELAGAPALFLVVCLAALFIGLRSAAPVELARRRQLEFTSDASHELRTPLSVIEAEIALTRQDHASSAHTGPAAPRDDGDGPEAGEGERTRDALDRIARESQRLRRIVDDLLWLARFDSVPPPAGAEPIDLVTIAESCVARFEPLAAARDVELRLDHVGSGTATVVAPAEWIDKLTGALVDNACKYAEEGGSVLVEVGRVGQRVILAVENSGTEIPEDVRLRMFDRFARGSRPGGGHGLGLAIADSVVGSTGGTWRIDKPAGLPKGTRMEVSWPAR